MSRPLIFVGSRNDIVRLAVVAELNGIEIAGILDHHYYGNTENMSGIPIIGDERWLLDSTNEQSNQWLQNCDFFAANWTNGSQPSPGELDLSELRLERISILERSGASVINLIHPDSIRGLESKYNNIKLGKGIFIDDDCWIDATASVEIGDYSVVAIGCRLSHRAKLGKNVTLAPEVFLANCEIADNSCFGMYSRINIQKSKDIDIVTVGENSTIWTGAEVNKHVPANSIFTDTRRIFKKRKYLNE
jgi:carbonic anhydrase/acetyltransferase-like protein (isoleucine patch superfamily)